MKEIKIFIPASFGAEERNMQILNNQVGKLARTAVTFNVTDIILYDDQDQKIDSLQLGRKLYEILTYIEMPQYLRKQLVKFSDNLKDVAALPPLRGPSHPKEDEKQEYREGVVVSCAGEVSEVFVGFDRLTKVKQKLKENQRVIVRLKKDGTGEIIEKKDMPMYWSFNIHGPYKSLGKALEKNPSELLIGTSKTGESVCKATAFEGKLRSARSVGIVFGGPFMRGLNEILPKSGLKKDIFDFYLNFVPNQGIRVVRVEEAVAAALSIINYLLESGKT